MPDSSDAAKPSGGSSGNTGQVRTVQRASRIITTLAEHPYPMGIVELAARVQLSPASVHRLLTTLVSIGWVDQNARTAKYRLGVRLMGVGTTGLVSNPIIQDGKMYLARLADWTGQDALLTTLVGLRTAQLVRAPGARSQRLEFEAGESQPAHAMADGKLLLAFVPDDERQRLYEVESLQRFTPNTITEPKALERELAKIRKQGYAVDNYERFASGRGVAVPILGTNGNPILAMLCVGELDPDAKAEKDLVVRMQSIAGEMTQHLSLIGDLPGQVRGAMASRRS